MLNPVRTGEHIPVLTMPSSVRLWRKIRWPLFITIVLVALVAVGLITNDRLVARSIARKIADAKTAEAAAKVEGLLETEEVLTALAARHAGRANAQAAYAWSSVLLSVLLGDVSGRMERSAGAFDEIASDRTSVGMAALAGRKYVQGDFKGALSLAEEGLGSFRDEPRLHLVRALALRADGRKEDGIAVLEAVRKSSFDYLPALHVALDAALEDGDIPAAKGFADELLVLSPGNLHGSLASVYVRLPGWNDEEPDGSTVAALESDMRMLRPRILKAPEKLMVMGRYLSGRVSLLSGQLDEAVEDLGFVDGRGGDPNVKAWFAMAVRRRDGASAALAVLEKAGRDSGPEMNSLRAQCYLDHHRIDEARAAIDALDSPTGGQAWAELAWVLAVRSGDLTRSKETLPAEIGGRLKWPAVEMFDLLRRAGDRRGIEDLKERLTGSASGCAKGIDAWMGGSVQEVNDVLGTADGDDACLLALTAKLMRGHMLPEQLEAAAGRAVSASEGQLSVRVDHAQAIWLAQGRDAAAAKLAQVREISPNGDLLRCSIAEAYLRMGLPAEALETTKGLTSARATALRIQATLDGVGKDEYLAAVAEAVGNESLKDHPAIVFWDLQQKLEGAKFDEVLGGADAVIETAGDWTAEIADLRAKAQNAMGSRGDADRSLLAAAKHARTRVGYDEEWQAKLALIRLNLRRGGNFLFKAVGVTLDMYKLGVKDAELSYRYAIANIRQGNERGAMKYLREAIELDPSFIPPFTQLNLMGKLEDDQAKLLQRTRPGAVLE